MMAADTMRDLAYRLAVSPGTVIDGWRVIIEPDYATTIDEFADCYGVVAPVRQTRWGNQQAERPAGFDGHARILTVGREGDRYWWQPPADIRDRAQIRMTGNLVADILGYGFVTVIVERCEGTDSYGHPIVVDHGAMGGIEPLPDEDTISHNVRELMFMMTAD